MKRTSSHQEISLLCTELSMLLHAGIQVGDALAMLAEESDAPQKEILSDMAKQMDGGATLSAACQSTGQFPAHVCGLIEAGEKTGRLENALAALAHDYQERVRMEQHIRSALLYPSIMLILMLVIIAVILIKVLPIFNEVYTSLGGRLTGLAESLLHFGSLLHAMLPALWVILAAVVIFLVLFATVVPVRSFLLSLWQNKQGDKGLLRKMNTARIAQTLAMGLASGLPMEASLELAAGLLKDTPAACRRCADCRALLERGIPQGEAMQNTGLLPAAQRRLLELGRRSGTEDAVMAKIADDFAEESEAALERRISRIEPTLVLVCSVLVGMILLSVMLPLTRIMTMIG